MKKIAVLLLCCLVVFVLVACGSKDNKTTATTAAGSDPSTVSSSVTSTETTPLETTPSTTAAPKPLRNETVILNDVLDSYYDEGNLLGEKDRMVFSAHWAASTNYPTRFLAGDEHWITPDKAPSGQSATCTITFFGNGIEVYGHTCSAGGMASITLDGVAMEKADFYSKSRVEALEGKYSGKLTPFFEAKDLENKEHVLVITFLPNEKNPAQSGNAEIAVDYAVITRIEGSNETAGADLPVVEGVFDAYIGDPYKYSYTSDYKNVYHSFEKLTDASKKESLTLFQNDLANSKIDVLVGKDSVVLKASASTFKNESGDTLPASCIELSFLDYVTNHQNGKKVYDVLGDAERAFGARTYGVLWVSVSTDENTPAGKYTGNILIQGNGTTVTFPYTVDVFAADLSKADDSLTVDLWQYPYSANRYYSGKTVKEYFGTDHTAANKTSLRNVYLDDKYMPQLAEQIKLYAKAGGDVITATIIEDSWNNQTTDPYPSMVKWTKTKDGTWEFDYTDFDKWVQLNLDNGVDGKIKCYSLGSWNPSIIYLNEATGRVYQSSYSVGSSEWKAIWTAFLKDFMAHVKEKGWFDKIYLAMDERSTEQIIAVCDVVHSVTDEDGKCFKMAMAVNRLHSEKYFDHFEDLSISSSQFSISDSVVQDRIEKGLSITFYTCGATAGALTNEPVDTLDFFYRLYQKGCNGYLRWALDAYTDDPLVDTYHWKFVPGDESLIYPDRLTDEVMTVQSSVRFQMMIESYRNLCALEVLKSVSDQAKTRVESVVRSYVAGSVGVKKMEQAIVTLANESLTPSK